MHSNRSHTYIAPLLAQLRAYKRKYYLNRLIGGALVAIALLLTAFLVVNALEFWGRFSPEVRTVLVYAYLGLLTTVVAWRMGWPLWQLLQLDKALTDEQAARQVGQFFPQVQDKLLNTLQLASLTDSENALLQASIKQRAEELKLVPFVKAIDLGKNRRYLRYVLPPVLAAVVLALFLPQFFTEGTTRLVRYKETFVAPAPFTFQLQNKDLTAYRGEDYTLELKLDGNTLPDAVYINLAGRPQRMEPTAAGYAFTLRNVQQPVEFSFTAAGFNSAAYDLDLKARPALLNFQARLVYPSYLGRQPEVLQNVGNLTVPQGTVVRWSFNSRDTDSLLLKLEADGKKKVAERVGDAFALEHRFLQSTAYDIHLVNQYAINRDPIKFNAEVIPDELPTIKAEQYQDSALYNYLLLGGNIADDHGLTRLAVYYRKYRKGDSRGPGNYRVLPIRIQPGQLAQQFVFNWMLDSLNLQPGDELDYYIQVWDNDGVSGPKSARTQPMRFALPDAKAIEQQLAEAGSKTEKQMEASLRKAESLRRDLQKAEEKLRGKNSLSFQDQKLVEDLLRKQQEVRKEVEALQDQFKKMQEQQNRFDKPNEEMAKKLDDLQKLMDQLLDPETKRLYDELQKLLEQRTQNPVDIKDMLSKIQKQENNLSKELDRTLELFKQMQVEQQANKVADKLDKLAEEQQKLAEATEKLDEKQAKSEKDQKGDKSDKSDKNDKGNKSDKSDKADKQDGKQDGKQSDKQDSKQSDKQDGKQSDKQDGKQSDKQDGNQDKDAGKPESQEQLEQKQKELQEEFKQLQDDMQKLQEMNKELDNPEKLPEQEKDAEDVQQEQQQSQQNLQQKQNKKASQNQKKAAQKMKKMASEMKEAMAQNEEEENEENAEDLRKILDNLLTLSFDQEALMKDFRGVYSADPRYVPLGQKQLKLRDDAKIIEDSLTALAKRVAQISSFITRELGDMKGNMDEATEAIKQKRQDVAAGKQQFAMTAMNNLASLLADVLKQMQDQNQQQSSNGSKGKKKKKPKPGQGSSLSQLQKQLNQQIQQLQQGQKSGRELSEQLAKMAAQQEALRKALAEMEKRKMMQEGGKEKGEKQNGGIGQLKELMEKTEQDLVNKRLTPEVIRRQADILTRLLEAENAMRERELDPKRESKTAKDLPASLPPSFSQYLQQKQQQVEMLKTLPPNLAPFYKQETSRYFQTVK